MDKNLAYLIKLLSSAIKAEQPVPLPDYNLIDWDMIFRFAKAHNISSIIFSSIIKLPANIQPNAELMKMWEDRTVCEVSRQIISNVSLKDVMNAFKNHNINVMLFKGIILSELYPEPDARISGDADLIINESDRQRSKSLLESLGFQYLHNLSKQNVMFFSQNGLFSIELHTRIFEDYYSTITNIAEKMNIASWGKRANIKVLDIEVQTLGYQEHLIYIIYHIVKHFIPKGIGLRHLTDLCLYVNHYFDLIDWDNFWKSIDLLGFTKFCELLFLICIEHFGMNPHTMRIHHTHSQGEKDMLLMDIVYAGVFGAMQDERKNADNIIRNAYYSGSETIKEWKLIFYSLFPNRNSLIKKFPYLKKWPVLLPFAWIQRLIKYLALMIKNKSALKITTDRLSMAESRITLLEKLDLINS